MSRFLACLVAAAVLAGCGFAAAPQKSEAAVLVGIGDQDGSMFSDPLFTQIGFKRARYFPSWNVAFKAQEATWLDQWLGAAQAHGVEPLIYPAGFGSLPGYAFTGILGIPAFVTPYGNADEANHAPNENLDLTHFYTGVKISASVYEALAQARS